MTNLAGCICPYYGAEIPDPEEKLNLDPKKIYQLYRDADELEKAASSCNGIQLMSEHIVVDAEKPQLTVTAGSTGTDAVFEAPYLKNSLSIWDEEDIANIESGKIKELSCGYSYQPDMTPGKIDCVAYDGIMRNIVFNHVALVKEGRAGSDCVVADSQINLTKELEMSKSKTVKLSHAAAMVKGALTANLKTILAKDQKIDIGVLVSNVKKSNWDKERPILVNGLRVATKGKLAADANLQDVVEMLDALKSEDMPADEEMDEPDGTGEAMDADGMMEKIIAAIKSCFAAKGAEDEPIQTEGGANADPKDDKNKEVIPVKGKDADKPDMVSKSAMDKAIAENAKAVEKATVARMHAIAKAEEQVGPYVGKLTAMDSADGVYRAALKIMQASDSYPGLRGVKIDELHVSALEPVLTAQVKPGEKQNHRLTQDSAIPQSAGKLISSLFPS